MEKSVNPEAGTYTFEEYLEMYMEWHKANSLDRNELTPPVDPWKAKFLGAKRVIFTGNRVILEEI